MFEVFKKELKELLRDRKTLIFVVALPVAIFPLLFAVMAFISSQAALEAEQEVHTYAIINGILYSERRGASWSIPSNVFK